jgi:putative flippase GtrA
MKLDTKTFVLVQQLIAYGFVGGLSSVLDLAIFVALTAAAFGPVAASIVSFTAATIANYFLSYFISFVRGRHSRRAEILRLVMVSLAGLVLNTLTVWALVAMGLLPLLAKVVAIGVVFGWNFIGRRMFVFERDLPPPVTSILRPENEPRRAG